MVGGEDDHLGFGKFLEDLAGRFKAIEQRHDDIDHHHVGAKFADQLNRLPAVLSFADHLNVGLMLQQGPETFADNLMVFRQQHSDLAHLVFLVGAVAGTEAAFRPTG